MSLWTASRPRFITYSPDYTDPHNKPYNLAPSNTGAFPGQVLEQVKGMQVGVTQQGEMFSGGAPGRTESQKSLGFLFETNSVPLSVPAGEIAKAFSGIYQYMLWLYKERNDLDRLELSAIDEAVAGIVLRPDGTMDMADNPIPDWWTIDVGIKDVMPTPKEQRKQELLQMLELQIIDKLEFIILNYQEDLGFPVGNKAIWKQYQKATFQNLVLFGDGKRPQVAVLNFQFDNPNIHLYAIDNFTSSAQFAMASDQVRKAFEERKKQLKAMLGEAPESIPPVADAAAQQMQAEQQQMQMSPEDMMGAMGV